LTQTQKPAAPAAIEDRPPVVSVEPEQLAPAHEALLLALDRMLTTGTYYPPGHAQYVAVADQCAEAIAKAMQGQDKIEIEVTAEGLNIGGGSVGKDERCAQRMHELLEPLNQAVMIIYEDVRTEHLHEALATLKDHHKKLVGTRDYQEIEIQGMPETVSVMGRSLYVRTIGGNGPEETNSPINEYFDPNLIPDAALVPTPAGQTMEREFLAVVQGLMKCGDRDKLRELAQADDARVSEILGTWVPDHAIKTIKDFLEALEATNSDPMLLQHLIGHAQTALTLTGDPVLVELVFEKLRKENLAKPKKQPLLEKRPKPSRKPVRFTLSRAELRDLIDLVHADAELRTDEDIIEPAKTDCLGICVQVLNVAPSQQLSEGIAATLRTVLGGRKLAEVDRRVVTDALIATFKNNDVETIDLIVSMLSLRMRRSHFKELGPLWLNIWNGMETVREKERVWPYAVNEVLMGLEWVENRQKLEFYQALSSINVSERNDLLLQLETMRSLKEKILAPDLFHAPAPLFYGVHQLLLNSTLAAMHGPQMHQRLSYQKAHPMVAALLDGFTEYDHARRNAYHAILAQGVSNEVVPDLQEVALRHLKGTLSRLPAERRGEPWVADAIRWFGKTGSAKARPVIEKILNEKKWFILPVWPASCRDAARDVLAGRSLRDDSKYTDERTPGGDDIQ
jgi:hypothetical protein